MFFFDYFCLLYFTLMNSKRSLILGSTAISLSAIMWGFDGVVLTPRLANLDIGFVVFILHAIPFLMMSVFFFNQFSFIKTFSINDYFYLILVAVFGGAIGTIAIVKALFLVNFQHLTIVVLLQKLQPAFAIALSAVFLNEKPGKNYLLWASVAIASGYFLTFGFHTPDFDSGANTVYAALFALLASFSFGSSTVFSKKILNRYSFQTATFFRYGFTSAIMLIVVIFSMNFFDQIKLTTSLNWLIFFIIAFTTGSGAIFLYYYGLKRVKAIVGTICELFFPISAVIFDYFFNDAKLTTVQWVSAAMMIFAIINLNLDRNKQPQAG